MCLPREDTTPGKKTADAQASRERDASAIMGLPCAAMTAQHLTAVLAPIDVVQQRVLLPVYHPGNRLSSVIGFCSGIASIGSRFPVGQTCCKRPAIGLDLCYDKGCSASSAACLLPRRRARAASFQALVAADNCFKTSSSTAGTLQRFGNLDINFLPADSSLKPGLRAVVRCSI